VLFSLYFKDIVVGQAERGTALWGLIMSMSPLLVALFAPVMGAIADYSHSRKLLLVIATYTTIVFTACLFFIQKGDVFWACLLFIFANFAFNMANVFYNSFLTDIAGKDEIGRISGIAWGVGYLGGMASLLIVLPIYQMSNLANNLHYRLSFLAVAVFYLLFTVPTFLWLKEPRKPNTVKKDYVAIGFQRLLHTARNIGKFKDLLWFLVSFFFYNDGITAVIAFASIYGTTRFDITPQAMIVFFIIAQPASFLGALLFGYLFDKIGAKRSINITLMLWVLVIFGAFMCNTKGQFLWVVITSGFLMGACQANSRTMFAQLTPASKVTEFFGFYGVMGRLASILSPIVYGFIALHTGNQRYSVLSILLFFVLGFIFLQTVDVNKGQHTALKMNEELK